MGREMLMRGKVGKHSGADGTAASTSRVPLFFTIVSKLVIKCYVQTLNTWFIDDQFCVESLVISERRVLGLRMEQKG
jgi:hypothetical protein